MKPVRQPLRPVPIGMIDLVEERLNELLRLDMIEPVEGFTPWVSALVPVVKGNGKLRLCVDMRAANKAIILERHPMPGLDVLASKLAGSKIFSTLDLVEAFHHVEIEQRSREITTFISHMGLFRYKVLMYGMNVAPVKFQSIMKDYVLKGLEGVEVYMDDILVYGKDQKEHDERLKAVLARLDSLGMSLNYGKCQLAKERVKFIGHIISAEGIMPCMEKIDTIQKFRRPMSKEELKSFLGLVDYVGRRFRPNIAEATTPLRLLLSERGKDIPWGAAQDQAFLAIKELLKEQFALGFYRLEDKTIVYADAGPEALGAILLQRDENGVERVVTCSSRRLTDAEKNYSQTEREALALVWAMKRFDFFLRGTEFDLVTDCQALKTLFAPTSKAPPRIERWVMLAQSYKFEIIIKPGKENIADSFSRMCKGEQCTSSFDETGEEYLFVLTVCQTPPATTINDIKQATEEDDTLKKVSQALKSGSWEKGIERYQIVQDELWCLQGIVLRGSRIVIPEGLQQNVLKGAHRGHPGMEKMKRNLRERVWWPLMAKQVEVLVKQCMGCQMVSGPGRKEPVTRYQLPQAPWQELATDLLGPLPDGRYVLTVIDYYSRFLEAKLLKSIKAVDVIKSLKEIFARHGNPMRLRMDNGPQFDNERMRDFLNQEGVVPEYTIPYWPQMNGLVENANKPLKKILTICFNDGTDCETALQEYLMMYRSTPHSTTGKSPFELLSNRKMRTAIPCTLALKDCVEEGEMNDEDVRDRDALQKQKGKAYWDVRHGAKEGGVMEGDSVMMQAVNPGSKWTPRYGPEIGKVVRQRGPDVTIATPSGGVYRRHASTLKQVSPADDSQPDFQSPSTVPDPEPKSPRELEDSASSGTPEPTSDPESSQSGKMRSDDEVPNGEEVPGDLESTEHQQGFQPSSYSTPLPRKRIRKTPAKFKGFLMDRGEKRKKKETLVEM